MFLPIVSINFQIIVFHISLGDDQIRQSYTDGTQNLYIYIASSVLILKYEYSQHKYPCLSYLLLLDL